MFSRKFRNVFKKFLIYLIYTYFRIYPYIIYYEIQQVFKIRDHIGCEYAKFFFNYERYFEVDNINYCYIITTT